MPHILVLGPNRNGSDFVIADMHGHYLDRLFDFLENQNQTTRVFFAGDLIDRGDKSLEILKKLKELQNNPKGPQIYIIKGNHEDFAEHAIREFENTLIACENDEDNFNGQQTKTLFAIKSDKNPIIIQYAAENNGGKWLVDLYKQEVRADKIYAINNSICYCNDSEIKFIKDFFLTLPYILHVKGGHNKAAFNIAHADMPLSDAELLDKVSDNDLTLKDEDIEYATCARTPGLGNISFQNRFRNSDSILTYVGHNVVIHNHNKNKSVRKNSNTINLDFGAWQTGIALFVDHSRKELYAITKDDFILIDCHLKNTTELFNTINKYWALEYDKLQRFCRQAININEHLHRKHFKLGFQKQPKIKLFDLSLTPINEEEERDDASPSPKL